MRRQLGLLSIRIGLLLCTAVLLPLSNLYGIATPAFIRYEYGKPQFPPADIYSPAERLSLAEATLHYLRSNTGVEYLLGLRSQGQVAYNPREVKHLMDVKAVMRGAFWLHAVCVLLFVPGLALCWRSSQRSRALHAVYEGCVALSVLLLAIGLLAYLNFDVFFTAFHRIFFAGDSWLFAFSDSLIQLFPVPFWVDATWTLAASTVAECVIIGAAAYALSRHQRLKEAL
jgi:integral membrane protein (TIGR01906 family)